MSQRLILVGRTGAGKSHFCKELGIETESRMSPVRVTVEWREWTVSIDGTQYILADTPGMYDRDERVTQENLKQVNDAFSKSQLTSVLYMFNAGYSARFERDDAEGITSVLNALGANASTLNILFNMHAITEDKRPEVFGTLVASVAEFDRRLASCAMMQYSGDTVGHGAKDIVLGVSQKNRNSVKVSGRLELLSDAVRQELAVKLRHVQEELERSKLEIQKQGKEAKLDIERVSRESETRLAQFEATSAQHVVTQLEQIQAEMLALQAKRNTSDDDQAFGVVFAPITGGLSLMITGIAARKAYERNKKLVSFINQAVGVHSSFPSPEAYNLLCRIKSMRPHGLITR